MYLADLVRQFLLADATIAGLIGTRVYPAPPPQNATYPLITTQRISDTQFPHLRQRGPGLAEPRYQIDAWATTKAGVDALASAIQHRLQGFTGVLTDTTVSPPVSHRVWMRLETDQDAFEGDVNGGFWRRSADYFIGHQGTAA